MFLLGRAALSAVGFLWIAMSASVAFGATVINVELTDQGSDKSMATTLGYGMPGGDMSKATMGITMSRTTAPAGVVTFKATNMSKDMVHEMIVVQIKDQLKPLSYSDGDKRVDEAKVADKGEVSELAVGKSGSLTVALKPGNYILMCNVAGHFADGMWTAFTITQ